MRPPDRRFPAALALAFAGALACGGEKPSAPAPAPAPRAEPAAPAPAPAGPSPAAKPPPAAAAPAVKPPPPPPPAAPAVKPPPAAAAPASAHAKVGPDKCKMCHRAQHQSWAESAHAKKGLDCEGCHGNGGGYWPAAVMRDRAKAVAAGLVLPGVDRCKGCHPKADASLLPRAHAHKAR